MDGSTEHDAPRGAAQSGSEQECDSMPAKAVAPRITQSVTERAAKRKTGR
jgi:hypothetical protein